MWIALSLNRHAYTNHVVYHTVSFLGSFAFVITNLGFLHMANVIFSLRPPFPFHFSLFYYFHHTHTLAYSFANPSVCFRNR